MYTKYQNDLKLLVPPKTKTLEPLLMGNLVQFQNKEDKHPKRTSTQRGQAPKRGVKYKALFGDTWWYTPEILAMADLDFQQCNK